ncbi:IS1/IS1595 family N-terminal zinc-binding domain-containing protein [Trueperella pyogenes]|uniref:IS1/IS1595 family N-terminal zinc-binding domain-containing protein n=1 Tax=Trueperella pyogenes TaxID=1661 RepID=UPI003F52D119
MHRVKKRSIRARQCPLCHSSMKKNGKNKSGSQRWYCPDCRYSLTAQRCDQSKAQQFRQFLAHVTGTAPRCTQTTSLSTWDRTHAWCWQTKPAWQFAPGLADHCNE